MCRGGELFRPIGGVVSCVNLPRRHPCARRHRDVIIKTQRGRLLPWHRLHIRLGCLSRRHSTGFNELFSATFRTMPQSVASLSERGCLIPQQLAALVFDTKHKRDRNLRKWRRETGAEIRRNRKAMEVDGKKFVRLTFTGTAEQVANVEMRLRQQLVSCFSSLDVSVMVFEHGFFSHAPNHEEAIGRLVVKVCTTARHRVSALIVSGMATPRMELALMSSCLRAPKSGRGG